MRTETINDIMISNDNFVKLWNTAPKEVRVQLAKRFGILSSDTFAFSKDLIDKMYRCSKYATGPSFLNNLNYLFPEQKPFTHLDLAEGEAMIISKGHNYKFEGHHLVKLGAEFYVIGSDDGHLMRYHPATELIGTRLPAGSQITFLSK